MMTVSDPYEWGPTSVSYSLASWVPPKVMVVIDGEKRGTGTYNGERVVLDPPLDTITPARIDSARIRVGPATREMYGVSYKMVGVLLVWLRPD